MVAPQGKKSQRKTPRPRARKTFSVRLALAQINTIVGDFEFNVEKAKKCLQEAGRGGADIVLFPELTLTGYPPEDLLLRRDFIKKNLVALKSLVPLTRGLTALVGYAEPDKDDLYNSAALLADGKHVASYRKMLLPNYGVFDEKRYFREGSIPLRFTQNGIAFGVTICEDIWSESGPGQVLCRKGGVDVLLNISASPFHSGKGKLRENMIAKRAGSYRACVVYTNLVGGQDELVFDGHSLVMTPNGKCLARGNAFAEELILVDLEIPSPKSRRGKTANPAGIKTCHLARTEDNKFPKPPLPPRAVHKYLEIEEIYKGLVLGTRDYILKNGFKRAVLGLSGGIDSALTAVIAADALGVENVIGVLMPSPYSSQGSVDDSLMLAENLQMQTFTFPIEKAMQAYAEMLAPVFAETAVGLAEENLQARIRGNILMALSNKFGWLVLTTGNKSEISAGYCTLYGDMAGGFAVIKDVPKTWVYTIAEYINTRRKKPVIPQEIIDKEPSAELRPNQRDTDSLPPYPVLDAVLARYVEEDKSVAELKKLKIPEAELQRITRMVDQSEYKRRQGPPGVKITPKAFGKDRRLPITNHYKG